MHYSLGLAASLAAAASISPPQESAGLFPDRPDFTESTRAVPPGRIQLEAGATYDSSEGQELLSGPEALFRIGLSQGFELRVGMPDYITTGQPSGFGDGYLGAKIELLRRDGLELALIPGTSVPIGRDGLTSNRWEPEAVLSWSGPAVGVYELAGGLIVAREGGGTAHGMTVSASPPMRGSAGVFLEYAGSYSAGRRPSHLAHFGATFPRGEGQLDMHFGVGLGEARFFIGAGYVTRF